MKQQRIYRKPIGVSYIQDMLDAFESNPNLYKKEQWLIDFNDNKNHFLLFLINNAIRCSGRNFNKLPSKIYLHYDWNVLFKQEIETVSKKIFETEEVIDFNLDLSWFVENSYLIEINEYEHDVLTIEDLSFNLSFRNNFVYFCKFTLGQYDERLLKRSKLFDNSNNSELVGASSYEKYNFTISYFLKKFKDQIECGLSPYPEDLEAIIPGTLPLIEIFADIYYLLFLKSCLRNKKFDLNQIDSYSYWTEPSQRKQNPIGNKGLVSYKWKPSKQGDLKLIYDRIKLILVNPSLKNFTSIFSGKEEITPIKTKFSSSELIYFIQSLMLSNHIELERNLSYERMKKCFVKEDGSNYETTNFKTLRHLIFKKDIDEGTFATLSQKKRKEIDNMICP